MSKLTSLGYMQCEDMQGFSAIAGPYYEKQELGVITRALEITEQHLNPQGVVHGGVSLAMMDFVIYRAIGDELSHDKQFATIQLNTNFLAAIKLGDIVYGRGSIQRSTRSVIFADGELYTADRSTMKGSGIWKVLGGK